MYCAKYPLGLSSLIAKIRPFEPIEQLLDDQEGGLQEDPVAEQEVLDIVGIGGVRILHELADHPVGCGAEQHLRVPATVLHPPHLAHLIRA